MKNSPIASAKSRPWNRWWRTSHGHAEVLYKSVGDRVAPDDVIAALNDANGAAPQLYFEIREERKTVDPGVWLKASP
jgi:murein DD-endopeptidase MepM/ murein hydrolase activator NlpD